MDRHRGLEPRTHNNKRYALFPAELVTVYILVKKEASRHDVGWRITKQRYSSYNVRTGIILRCSKIPKDKQTNNKQAQYIRN